LPDKDDPEGLELAGGEPAEREESVERRLEELEVRILRYHFEGPLPHPDLLARYNQIIPNGAERILSMAEEQGRHRRELEKKALDSSTSRANWGLVCGAVVALVALGLSALAVLTGHSVEGAFIAGVDLAGLVSVFVYGSNNQRNRLSSGLPFPRTSNDQERAGQGDSE
jgi:uncharacterized membrane protein